MLRDVVVLLSCGSVIYLWLCAIVSPLATAVQSVMRQGTNRTAWTAVALAAGGAMLWTAVAAGVLALAMMLEPRTGWRVLASEAGWRGVSVGFVVWSCHLMAFAHAPRIGAIFEMGTALAMVAFVHDDPWVLSRVERLYRLHAIDARTRRRAVSRRAPNRGLTGPQPGASA